MMEKCINCKTSSWGCPKKDVDDVVECWSYEYDDDAEESKNV